MRVRCCDEGTGEWQRADSAKRAAIARRREPPGSGFPISFEAAHHSASSARSRSSPRVGLLTFVASRRRVRQPKTDSAETTVLADEIEDLDTTTPDSADTGIAETSADSLNSASEVSNDDIDNAQAESNAKDSDTEDTTAKDQRSKKTNSRKHKKPQKPNKWFFQFWCVGGCL